MHGDPTKAGNSGDQVQERRRNLASSEDGGAVDEGDPPRRLADPRGSQLGQRPARGVNERQIEQKRTAGDRQHTAAAIMLPLQHEVPPVA
jgi:hypothetical protein